MAWAIILAAALRVGAAGLVPAAAPGGPDSDAEQRIQRARAELQRPDAGTASRTAMAVMLFLHREPSARRTLLEALAPSSPSAVRTAVCAAVSGDALPHRPDEAFDLPVLECLSDPDPVLREEAAAAVGRLAGRTDSRLLETLESMLRRNGLAPDHKLAVVRALGHTHSKAAFEVLVRLLDPSDPAVEAAAVEGLQRITARTELTAAREWRFARVEFDRMTEEEFRDQARRLRVKRLRKAEEMRTALEDDLVAAESALYDLRPAEQRPAFLSDRLRHRQPCVRIWAAGKLNGLADKDVLPAMLPPLLDGLDQEPAEVRAACAAALPFVEERLPRPAGTAPLGPARLRSRLEREGRPEVVAVLITALAAYRDPQDIVVVGRRLTDPRERVAEAAAAAFAELARPPVGGEVPAAARPFLDRLLDLTLPGDPASPRGPTARIAAIRASARLIPDTRLVRRFSELLDDPSAEVREEVVLALEPAPGMNAVNTALLGRLGDPNRRVRTAAIQTLSAGARDALIAPVLAALEGRLEAETDAEVRQRVVTAIGTVAAKTPAAEQLARAERYSKMDAAHKRTAVEIRRRLLEPGGPLKDDDARRACLAALAELHEQLGDATEAGLRHRQLALLLRTREPDAARRSAVIAFRAAAAGKQHKEAWDWMAEWAGKPGDPAAAAGGKMLDELAAMVGSGAEDVVLEFLAAAPADAPWLKAEPLKSRLADLRTSAEGRRSQRMRDESRRQVRAWLAARGTDRRAALTALQLAGDAGLAAAVAALQEELAMASPAAAVEADLIALCAALVESRPDKPFKPAAWPKDAPLKTRRETAAAWAKALEGR